MLLTTNYSILKIALNNGFNSLEYYSEIFKKVTGFNPITFKKTINYNLNNKPKAINKLLELTSLEAKTNYYITNIKPKSLTKILKLK